jgi:hypothetical protein
MTPRSRYNFFLDADQKAALNQIKERDGILVSEQIRRAIKEWIAERGVAETKTKKKAERKRPASRRRS